MTKSSLCGKRPRESSLADVEGQDQSSVEYESMPQRIQRLCSLPPLNISEIDAAGAGASTSEYRRVVETKSENEVDGYEWRKYGRKPIKGNEHLRHYFRCTTPGCRAIKYIQKSSYDSTKFIITYKRQHDHNGSSVPQKLEEKYENIVWDDMILFRAIIIPNQDLKIDLNIPNQDLEIDLNDEELQNKDLGTPSNVEPRS